MPRPPKKISKKEDQRLVRTRSHTTEDEEESASMAPEGAGGEISNQLMLDGSVRGYSPAWQIQVLLEREQFDAKPVWNIITPIEY